MVLPGLLVAALLTGQVWIGTLFITNIVITGMYLLYAIMNNTEIALTMFPVLAETESPNTGRSANHALGKFPDANRPTQEILESLKLTITKNAT